MTAKEYLKSNDCAVTHDAVAKLMFPTNKSAKTYMSAKLSGKGNRSWTDSDEKKATKILHNLGAVLNNINQP